MSTPEPVPDAPSAPAPLPLGTTLPAARKQIQVALAVIFDPQTPLPHSLLICKRQADVVLGGYWEFPGGKCHPGESPAACAIRETLEETALVVRPLVPLPIIDHDYPHACVRLHPFLCEKVSGALQLLAVAEAQWVLPHQLAHYHFPEANAPLLALLEKGCEPLLQDRDSARLTTEFTEKESTDIGQQNHS